VIGHPASLPKPLRRTSHSVAGILDGRWTAWFEGLQVSSDGEETVISGPVADQTALHGLLTKVRDLGLFLISVRHIDPRTPIKESEK
jgi:hypothetical protein